MDSRRVRALINRDNVHGEQPRIYPAEVPETGQVIEVSGDDLWSAGVDLLHNSGALIGVTVEVVGTDIVTSELPDVKLIFPVAEISPNVLTNRGD